MGLVGGSSQRNIESNLVGVQLVYRLMCLLEWENVYTGRSHVLWELWGVPFGGVDSSGW